MLNITGFIICFIKNHFVASHVTINSSLFLTVEEQVFFFVLDLNLTHQSQRNSYKLLNVTDVELQFGVALISNSYTEW